MFVLFFAVLIITSQPLKTSFMNDDYRGKEKYKKPFGIGLTKVLPICVHSSLKWTLDLHHGGSISEVDSNIQLKFCSLVNCVTHVNVKDLP